MAKTEVEFANETYIGDSLTDREEQLLKAELYGALGPKGTLLGELFSENEAKIIGAAEVAKEKFDAPFNGIFAGDSQYGIQLIRPGHLLRTTGTTETCDTTWIQTLTADDDYWIGYSTNNQTAINVDKRACVLVLAFAFTQGTSPVTEELYLVIGNTTFPVVVLRHAWWADNPQQVRYTRVRPMILVPKVTALGRLYQELAGEQQLVAVGVTFAMGDLLRTRELSAVQT